MRPLIKVKFIAPADLSDQEVSNATADLTEVTQSVEKKGQDNLKSDDFSSFVNENSVLALKAEAEVIEKTVTSNDENDNENDNQTENDNEDNNKESDNDNETESDNEVSETKPDTPSLVYPQRYFVIDRCSFDGGSLTRA